MSDTRFLEQASGGKWRVVLNVPKSVQKTLGKTKLKRALGTDSLDEANRLKWSVIAELRAELTAAERGDPSPNETAEVLRLAADYRERISRLDTSGVEAERLREEIHLTAESLLGGRAYVDSGGEIAPPEDRSKLANQFTAIALAAETPLAEGLARFHSQGPWNNRTRADSTRALGYLTDWCRRQGIPETVESITRKRAGAFVGDLVEGVERPDKRKKNGKASKAALAARTINKYITCLSRYWGWLEKRGYLAEGSNVWARQTLPEAERADEDKERPFTDDELKRLFEGTPAQPYLKPLMAIAALTGARIGAIIELKVKDTDGGCFLFKPQKQEKSTRRVPIHSALQEVVAGLTKGKQPDDDLFPECPPLPPGDARERSMPASKAFGRYRKSVGVDDPIEGNQRGLVNFHSFRRTFVTRAFQAGQSEAIIQAVVGHKPSSVTRRHYHGGFALEQLRDCVESVKLLFD